MCRRNCVPSPAPSMRALDQPGNVRDHKTDFILRIAHGNHSQVGLERGEGIIRNLRARRGNARDQRGLAHVRISHQAHVGQQLQFQPVSMFLAGTARLMLARRLMHRCGKARVAASAAPAAGNHEALIGLRELEDFVAGLVVVDDRSDRNFQDDAVAIASGLVRTFAVASALRRCARD